MYRGNDKEIDMYIYLSKVYVCIYIYAYLRMHTHLLLPCWKSIKWEFLKPRRVQQVIAVPGTVESSGSGCRVAVIHEAHGPRSLSLSRLLSLSPLSLRIHIYIYKYVHVCVNACIYIYMYR